MTVQERDCHIPTAILAQCTCPMMMMTIRMKMVDGHNDDDDDHNDDDDDHNDDGDDGAW